MKNNKKGMVDDFGSLLVGGLFIVALTIGILFYSGLQERSYLARPSIISNLEEASYTTRAILEWELESGMKVHEALVKYNSENNIEEFAKVLQEALEKQDLLPRQTWLLLVNSQKTEEPILKRTVAGNFQNVPKTGMGVMRNQYVIDTSTSRVDTIRNSYLALTRVTIPDGENSIIEVVIKQLKSEDEELYNKIDQLN
jgi:hypothetical protein